MQRWSAGLYAVAGCDDGSDYLRRLDRSGFEFEYAKGAVTRNNGMARVAVLDAQMATGEFGVLMRVTVSSQKNQAERDHQGQHQA